jgi:hypothetical protein
VLTISIAKVVVVPALHRSSSGNMPTKTFASGTGNWHTFTSLVITSEPGARCETVDGALVVRTPLDLILLLETDQTVSEVVLAGTYADNATLLAFLRDLYPRLPIAFEPTSRTTTPRSETLDDACLWLG